MKHTIYILLLLSSLLFNSCANNDSLFDELSKIENSTSKKCIQNFSKDKESTISSSIYTKYNNCFNSEIESINQNLKLKLFFSSKGINNSGDIVKIIFICLHRKINLKKMNLEGQIQEIKRFELMTNACKDFEISNLKKNDKYVIGDTIKVRMQIDYENVAYPSECFNSDWKFDDKKDLIIVGKILDKYTYENIPSNVFIKIKVLDVNKNNVLAPTSIISNGQIYSLVINYNIIDYYKVVE